METPSTPPLLNKLDRDLLERYVNGIGDAAFQAQAPEVAAVLIMVAQAIQKAYLFHDWYIEETTKKVNQKISEFMLSGPN
jgi:hypothetical protein